MSKESFLHRLLGTVSAFRRDKRGNVAIIVGAAIIPLVGSLGLATDTARGYLVKARLSQALDAAALAGGKVFYSASRDDDMLKFFKANFATTAAADFGTEFTADFMEAAVTLDEPVEAGPTNAATLTLTAQATIPTTFMRVLGFETVTVSAQAQVTRAITALDAVISLDMSGSMDGAAKIGAARDAAIEFVETVFGDDDVSPQLTVDGTTYDLLNIGFVPWNSKVNVTTQGVAFNSGATVATAVPAFTSPVTGASQSTIWTANNSQVPLLSNPNTLPGGWNGCIWARYLGDDNSTNDADLVRGTTPGTLPASNTVTGDWKGWEPMGNWEGEPRNGDWTTSEGGGVSSSWTRWSENSDWRRRSCYNAYINDNGSSGNYDNAAGTIKTTSPNTTVNTSRPRFSATFPSTGFRSAPVSGQYTGTFRFWANSGSPAGNNLATTSYAQPGFGNEPDDTDCTPCLSRGIIPLQPSKTVMTGLLGSILDTDPDGNTNAVQGLYWAWEVMMPGAPFNEAVVTTPFPRIRAIILLTDGAQVGGNGDAYKGRFGQGEGAGTNTNAVHGQINVGGTNVQNNLNSRFLKLAENIKSEGIRLYTIGFDLASNPVALNLLDVAASDPDDTGEYFFNAPTTQDLEDAFKQIAASLTNLRLSM